MISLSYAFRSTGSVAGIAMASVVFQNVLSSQLWARLGARTNAAELISGLENSLEGFIVFCPYGISPWLGGATCALCKWFSLR